MKRGMIDARFEEFNKIHLYKEKYWSFSERCYILQRCYDVRTFMRHIKIRKRV